MLMFNPVTRFVRELFLIEKKQLIGFETIELRLLLATISAK